MHRSLLFLYCFLSSFVLYATDTLDGFVVEMIPDTLFQRMQGKSYKLGCPVKRSDLRLVKVKHFNYEGQEKSGRIVCHKEIATDLVLIFQELYLARYPIERIEPIDDYNGSDVRSMEANNSSAFNYRRVAGSKRLSAHSFGRAVDINPRYNPFVGRNGQTVSPPSSRKYTARNKKFRYKIQANDLCVRLFKKYGFRWGGDWRTVKDYQHFEKSASR